MEQNEVRFILCQLTTTVLRQSPAVVEARLLKINHGG
jgi:hypothetical protein